MKYRDLRDFISQLAAESELKEIVVSVSPHLEMTEVSSRVLTQNGPALLFRKPTGYSIPVLTNLFGNTRRIARAMGGETVQDLRRIGLFLASLKEPEQPGSLSELFGMGSMLKSVLDMRPKERKDAPCREIVMENDEIDLGAFPVQTCWPEDAGPLITWGLVVTKGPGKKRQNLGVYRQQVIGKNKLIMRWLAHRGGAQDFREHKIVNKGKPFPVAVVIGADPATLLSAVTPIPDELSEYQFAGLLRGSRTELVRTFGSDLMVPANAEMVFEGHIYPDGNHGSGYEHALEGPFGDHTGYYNEPDWFPVMTIERITMRKNPLYLSTYTGRPPDEPAMLGLALNEVFVPLLQKQFSEIVDFYLPAETCSYRFALVKIRKAYPGHARRVMFGVWSYLRQFLYTKFIIVVDEDIDIRNWGEVLWAISTRVDPVRDTVLVDNTPIDYLDFASPVSGLGGKMGIDATDKWQGETNRTWGKKISMSAEIRGKVDGIWEELDW